MFPEMLQTAGKEAIPVTDETITYHAVGRGEDSSDLIAVDTEGNILAVFEDTGCRTARAANVAYLYTENRLPLPCFHSISEQLLGVLL